MLIPGEVGTLVSTNGKHTKFCHLVLDSDHRLMLFRHVGTPAVPLNCAGVLLGEKCLSDPSLQSINTVKHRNLSPLLFIFAVREDLEDTNAATE